MAPRKNLTMLTCEVGNHTGSFAITRTAWGWACDKCRDTYRLRVVSGKKIPAEKKAVEVEEYKQPRHGKYE